MISENRAERVMKMTYEEARAFLEGCNQYAGESMSLDPLKELLRRLGNPQDQLRFVHIAGTNGKGSVLAYLSSVLKSAGYRTGRYISPTIFEYRERIQVDEAFISEADLARLIEKIQTEGRRMLEEGFSHPTMFEAETALAFLYFAEKDCDLVVLETGMGGRDDATNVVKNTELAVLASISMDHMGFLGNTLEEIAENKAGIIKPDCTVVTMRQQPEADQAIRKKAEALGCQVDEADPALAENRKRGLGKQSFDYKGWKNVEIALAGEYQFANAALALEAVEALRKRGYQLSEEAVRIGMAGTRWIGRFSLISSEPDVILDGAHNRDAARMLRESIERYLFGRRLIYIIGVLADKEYELLVKETAPFADQIITVMTPDNPRALPAEELAAAVRKYHDRVQAARSLKEAVELAYEKARREDVILAFGSLSYLGALAREVQRRKQ